MRNLYTCPSKPGLEVSSFNLIRSEPKFETIMETNCTCGHGDISEWAAIAAGFLCVGEFDLSSTEPQHSCPEIRMWTDCVYALSGRLFQSLKRPAASISIAMVWCSGFQTPSSFQWSSLSGFPPILAPPRGQLQARINTKFRSMCHKPASFHSCEAAWGIVAIPRSSVLQKFHERGL